MCACTCVCTVLETGKASHMLDTHYTELHRSNHAILNLAGCSPSRVDYRSHQQPHQLVLFCFVYQSQKEWERRCIVATFKFAFLLKMCEMKYVTNFMLGFCLYFQARELLFLLCWQLRCLVSVFTLLFWQLRRFIPSQQKLTQTLTLGTAPSHAPSWPVCLKKLSFCSQPTATGALN